MAINVADNFSYKGAKPLDARFQYATVADMKNTTTSDLYDGCWGYVKANKTYYSYDSTNSVDPTTGKWREFEGGGGASLPAGGTTGQSLVKHSNTDEDVEWFDVNKTIEYEDFEDLSQADKDNGTAYFIPDASIVSNITVMGNRFDKANIYTTTERMIGSWLGKPLYQKIINIATPDNVTDGTFKNNSYDLTDLSIDTMVDISGRFFSSTYGMYNCNPVFVSNSGGQIKLNYAFDNLNVQTNFSAFAGLSGTAIIQYTKTNDATVNIGTGNDYSTDEQIIGTWIDGKPLYQKTIYLGNLPNATTANVNTEISNAKRLINYFATATDSNGGQIAFPRLWIGGTGDIYIGFGANLSTINIATTSDRSGMTGYCTVQYTKTTD